MNNSEVRAIVPGRINTHNRATLRAVTVERKNNGGALALAYMATEEARKIHPGFRAAPSVTSVLIALPEDPPDPIFEQLWEVLTFTPEEKTIHITAITDSDGALGELEVVDLPTGWKYTTEYHEDERAAQDREEEAESIRQCDDGDRYEDLTDIGDLD